MPLSVTSHRPDPALHRPHSNKLAMPNARGRPSVPWARAALCVRDAARALAKGHTVQTGQTPAQRQRRLYPDTDHQTAFLYHEDFALKVLALLVR